MLWRNKMEEGEIESKILILNHALDILNYCNWFCNVDKSKVYEVMGMLEAERDRLCEENDVYREQTL
jgi:hypothetical protein